MFACFVSFVLGAGISVYLFYRFYHINAVKDLKRIIDELSAKVKSSQ